MQEEAIDMCKRNWSESKY